jgi:hypothetical protein
MKKINSILMAFIAGIAIVSAQNPVQKKYPELKNSDAKVRPGSLTERVFSSSNKTNEVESLWISYAASMQTYQENQGNTPSFTRAGNYLFPDSLPVAEFGGGSGGTTYGSPWVHALSSILDLKSPAIETDNQNKFIGYTEYTLDSMAMNLIYVRNHVDTSIVDTLVINVMTNDKGSNTTSNFPAYSFSGTTASNYGVSKLSFMDIPFDTSSVINNGVYDTVPGLIPQALSRQADMVTIKVPLTAADSSKADAAGSSFIKTIVWAVNMSVNATKKGKVVGAFVTFKPGFSYHLNDSLSQMNYVRFFSREENDGGFQTYFPNDWNVSAILSQEVRYGQSPGNWNGLTLPSFAYTAPYRFEYHDILWKVTGLNLSVSKVEDRSGNSISNVYPNPANGNEMVTVPFSLSKASSVSINLVDAQGRVLRTINTAKFNEGSNQVEISTEGLSNGLYYINMNIDGSNIAKSLSIVR